MSGSLRRIVMNRIQDELDKDFTRTGRSLSVVFLKPKDLLTLTCKKNEQWFSDSCGK